MVLNPLTYGRNRWFFLLGLVGLAGLHFFGVWYFLGMDPWTIALDALVSWVILGAVMFLVSNTLSYYHPSRGRVVLVTAVPLVMAYLWMKLSVLLIGGISQSVDYDAFLMESRLYRFTVVYLILMGITIISLIWYRLGEKEDEQRRNEETERMAKEAELFKLRQQLQPHFLFNSLNSINSLIGSRPQEARSMVQQLSEFLRGTLRREDQKVITLKEELEYLRLYLDIEQVRFGHRLKVEMDCEEDLLEWKLPPLILQPVLENAIKFGLYGTTGNLVINFNCEQNDNLLMLSITNPFDPDMQPPSGTGFGLRSVKRRLYLLFARTDLLQAGAYENEYTVKIKIPMLND